MRYGLSGDPIGDDDQKPDTCWRAVVLLERRWLEKQYRKPRCTICDAPMVCGQTDSHITCQRLLSALAGSGDQPPSA